MQSRGQDPGVGVGVGGRRSDKLSRRPDCCIGVVGVLLELELWPSLEIGANYLADEKLVENVLIGVCNPKICVKVESIDVGRSRHGREHVESMSGHVGCEHERAARRTQADLELMSSVEIE